MEPVTVEDAQPDDVPRLLEIRHAAFARHAPPGVGRQRLPGNDQKPLGRRGPRARSARMVATGPVVALR